MNSGLEQMIQQLHDLELRIADELHRQTADIKFRFQNGKIVFEDDLRNRNKALKRGLIEYFRAARWPIILTAPVIYLLIIPFVILDLFVSIYQAICFPIYGIPKVSRGEFLVFDRFKLDYLNGLEKFNCGFCSYCNGIIAFVTEVAARTEQYWCPIKHAQKRRGLHQRYPLFTDYGDGEQYHGNLKTIRRQFMSDQERRTKTAVDNDSS